MPMSYDHVPKLPVVLHAELAEDSAKISAPAAVHHAAGWVVGIFANTALDVGWLQSRASDRRRPPRWRRRSPRRSRHDDTCRAELGVRHSVAARDQSREDAVDETAGIVGREALGQFDRLVEHDGDRHVGSSRAARTRRCEERCDRSSASVPASSPCECAVITSSSRR